MAQSGMEMLLGKLTPDGIKTQVEGFIANMQGQAQALNENQRRIEAKLDSIEGKLDTVTELLRGLIPQTSTTPIMQNGEATGVLITNEKFPQEMLSEAGIGG
jgi:hypothetical protein